MNATTKRTLKVLDDAAGEIPVGVAMPRIGRDARTTLESLIRLGLVSSRVESWEERPPGRGRPRRFVAITEPGRRLLHEAVPPADGYQGPDLPR